MTELGIYSNLAVAILYAFLALLLLINWRGSMVGGLLILACAANIVWAMVLAADLYGYATTAFAVFLVEVLRTGAWLSFVAIVLAKIGGSRRVYLLGILSWVVVILAGFALHFRLPPVPAGTSLASILNVGQLVMTMIGLLLVEQLQRNSSDEPRQGMRLLVLGVGGIFAYDLFFYSQNLMLGGAEPWTWLARGLMSALVVPIIAVVARANTAWELKIFVSRQVVFFSTTLFAVGIYLLAMSGVGYWIVIQGRTWSSLASVAFVVGAGMLLVFLLFSSNLRARLKVFLSKHFFRNKYDYREEWLRLIATLASTDVHSARQPAIKALAQISQSPGGVLWLLDEGGTAFRFVAAYNFDEPVPDISASDSLVAFIDRDGWLVDLEEFNVNPGLYDNLELPKWLPQLDDAWLITPLITHATLIGLVMLTKAAGPLQLNYEDRDLLKTVGNHVAVHLAQERANNLLAESRQFEAYNRLTAFLMHDLNNLIAQQSLIVANASKHKRNPDFVDDAMNTIAGSVERMKRVMNQLRSGDTSKRIKPIELKFIVSAAADRCSGGRPVPELEFNDNGSIVEVDMERLTMVLTHIILNAQDATPPDGEVVVRTEQVNGRVSIAVTDNGCGMTDEFIRERLFRPFDSTKGNQGMGIGVYQARDFARRIGGDLTVSSVESQGTTMILSFPLRRQTST